MGGATVKALIAAFLLWLSAQLGLVLEQVLGRVTESVQATELLTVDRALTAWAIEQQRPVAPRGQEQFERILRAELAGRLDRDVTLDRWEQPYVYELVSERPVAWRIVSGGPDRRVGSEDDLVVERREDRVSINRDPQEIVEQALERKQAFDRELLERLETLARAIEVSREAEVELDDAYMETAERLDGLFTEE